MARPSLKTVGDQGWDAVVNDNNDVISVTPFPPARFATVGALPTANLYDGCIAEVTGVGLYISENSIWVPIPTQGAAVADVGVLTAVTSFAECDAHFATLQAKVDAFLAVLRTSKGIDT